MIPPELGILVLGYARPKHLEAVLESLRLQQALATTHVWIDGTSGRKENKANPLECFHVAARYSLEEIRFHKGHLGAEKLMLDALSYMAIHYEKIVVLEDDCFPTANAIIEFNQSLDIIAEHDDIFSTYGHHFLVPAEGETITRFQGWGWATTKTKLAPVLERLRILFNHNERKFLSLVQKSLSPGVLERLSVTPGRSPLDKLGHFFSWDESTALITAMAGLSHMKTPRRVVYNCGLGSNSGHFNDSAGVRTPPFNMISLKEVWDVYNSTADVEGAQARVVPWLALEDERKPDTAEPLYFGLEGLDKKVAQYVAAERGVFIELGAFNGVAQSNTLHFEQKGWRGILIEPVYSQYCSCVINRPRAAVFNYACVADDDPRTEIEMTAVGLMSFVEGAFESGDQAVQWAQAGEKFQNIRHYQTKVPARTLNSIIEEVGLECIDFLSLDVEGFELSVLKGLDLNRHRPRFILCEDKYDGTVLQYLSSKNYTVRAILSERELTRDILYEDSSVSS